MEKQFCKLVLTVTFGLCVLVQAQKKKAVVGINTNNPQATLDIVTKMDLDKSLRIRNTSGKETFTFTNSGYLGIGTVTPTAQLDVEGRLRVGEIPTGDINTDQVLLTDAKGNVKKADFKEQKKDTSLNKQCFTKDFQQKTDKDGLIFQWPEGYTQDNSFYVVEQMKSENVTFKCQSYDDVLMALWSVEKKEDNSILIQLKPQGSYDQPCLSYIG